MPRRARIELWLARNGRWYYHRAGANGQVSGANSCASRRSARRSAQRDFPGLDIVLVSEP